MSFAVGVDLVHIPGFAAQLEVPGSRFEAVFSALELRVAAGKGTRRAEHLAGRWAAKEAFIKAWSQALYGAPPVVGPDAVDFSQLEIRPDAWGRVAVVPTGDLARAVADSVGALSTSLSISHDGDYATATVILF
ncbi:4'-phosphopantetheinyl transferase [Corynebacterium phocae]|uniref:4'-phosphopantetheinyl transferase n=1 Tax=Corynebacterium phocae TaxID=161895 RepID=A0A1L7D1P9_9CORY|nr:holo-ACP synthase [Corynebacterium phocae]APT92028.1 4'-phosphopantetheinyl transferase [Corynebacterium phocae]KAA8726409.1 holo-ACP synthase [Corynebacterium phocae]